MNYVNCVLLVVVLILVVVCCVKRENFYDKRWKSSKGKVYTGERKGGKRRGGLVIQDKWSPHGPGDPIQWGRVASDQEPDPTTTSLRPTTTSLRPTTTSLRPTQKPQKCIDSRTRFDNISPSRTHGLGYGYWWNANTYCYNRRRSCKIKDLKSMVGCDKTCKVCEDADDPYDDYMARMKAEFSTCKGEYNMLGYHTSDTKPGCTRALGTDDHPGWVVGQPMPTLPVWVVGQPMPNTSQNSPGPR
jgi:hypothetical protein